MIRFCFLLLTVLIASVKSRHGPTFGVRKVAEWKQIEYAFPSEELKQSAIAEGKYVPENPVTIDMDVDYRQNGLPSRVFATSPRFMEGIPITLGVVSNNFGTNGPLIEAYPDYSWQSSHGTDCDGITSVYRIAIDKCNRLWVMDTGRIGDNQHCPPQLVVFNLLTDTLLHRYKFPEGQYISGTSLFINPVVDVRDRERNCRNTMVYVSDVTGYGLVVYDYRKNLSWRVQNEKFNPNENLATFTIAGESFELSDGIFGLAIGHRSPQIQHQHHGHNHNHINGHHSLPTEKYLFFHPLASYTEYAVPINLLDDPRNWQSSPDANVDSFVEIGERGVQSAAEAMDKNGNLFFGLMNPIAIACWDSRTQYHKDNFKIVVQNNETLQFASGLKIIKNNLGLEELWVSTCRFQKIMTGSIDYNEVNFRIQSFPISQLLGGATHCTKTVTFPQPQPPRRTY